MLTLLCSALFMVFLDTTVVNVALPRIQQDMSSTMSELQWVIDAYTLVFASLLLSAGAAAERFGARTVLVAGVGIFAVASVACAVAPDSATLLTARALQGVGGAIVMPISLIIINRMYIEARQRSLAIGIWSGMGSLALAAGPIVGGVLVDHFGWQSIFWINVPVGIATGFALWFLTGDMDTRSQRAMDLGGQVLFIVGVGLITFGLIEGNRWGWQSASLIVCMAAAVASLAAFVWRQTVAAEPVLPMDILRNRAFIAPNIIGAAAFFSLTGVIFLFALFLQNLQFLSPLQAGVRFLPLTVAIAVSGVVAGVLCERANPYVLMISGSVLVATGLGLATRIRLDSPLSEYWYGLVVLGIGTAFAVTPATVVALKHARPDQVGVTSGILNTCRQVGGVMGVAILASVATTRFTDTLPTALSTLSASDGALRQIQGSLSEGDLSGLRSLPEGADSPVVQVLGSSFVDAMITAMWVGVALNLLAAVLALLSSRAELRAK
ncbi:MFS transporter [Rhodococcoides fascians]|uniref:MFS transporter n=1 Tax=Rhodococcoides fascians TaxID=1828 RepID=UPI001E2E5604|nr:MFS transporter [Rhodococcus fascians]